jgi:hypothetical protein
MVSLADRDPGYGIRESNRPAVSRKLECSRYFTSVFAHRPIVMQGLEKLPALLGLQWLHTAFTRFAVLLCKIFGHRILQ